MKVVLCFSALLALTLALAQADNGVYDHTSSQVYYTKGKALDFLQYAIYYYYDEILTLLTIHYLYQCSYRVRFSLG